MASSIDYFGRTHWLSKIQQRVSLHARRRMFEQCCWGEAEQGGLRILDVGSTPDLERKDSNCFINWFLERGDKVHAASVEDISVLKERYPELTILEKMPVTPLSWNIKDEAYDWCISSAVLEHVGTHNDQVHFLSECGRTSQRVFLTTPNRYHWLEFHTKLPFIHWLPKNLHRRILRGVGVKFWAEEAHLNLLSKKDLEHLAVKTLGRDFTYTISSVWTLGMPSNFVLIAHRRQNA